jgi:hypothetical protein
MYFGPPEMMGRELRCYAPTELSASRRDLGYKYLAPPGRKMLCKVMVGEVRGHLVRVPLSFWRGRKTIEHPAAVR